MQEVNYRLLGVASYLMCIFGVLIIKIIFPKHFTMQIIYFYQFISQTIKVQCSVYKIIS